MSSQPDIKLFRRVLPETQPNGPRVAPATLRQSRRRVLTNGEQCFAGFSYGQFGKKFAAKVPGDGPLRPILAGVHVSLCSFVIRLFAFVSLESDIEGNRIVNPKPSAISSMIGNPATIAFALGEWNAQVI